MDIGDIDETLQQDKREQAEEWPEDELECTCSSECRKNGCNCEKCLQENDRIYGINMEHELAGGLTEPSY